MVTPEAEFLYMLIKVVGVLAGFFITMKTLLKPFQDTIASLSTAINTLKSDIQANTFEQKRMNDHIDSLKETVDSNDLSNKKSHERIWNNIDDISDKVDEHDKRILKLEDWRDLDGRG